MALKTVGNGRQRILVSVTYFADRPRCSLVEASYFWGALCHRASLVAQLVKNPLAMQETLVRFLGQEDSLEKGKATHSSILGLPLWFRW